MILLILSLKKAKWVFGNYLKSVEMPGTSVTTIYRFPALSSYHHKKKTVTSVDMSH